MSTAYSASYAPLPTAAETASARARISSQRDDIQRAEQEIIGLEGQITVLRTHTSRIRDVVALDENLIEPVRRVPYEILAAVVVLLATDKDTNIETLRTLSSIHRVWRDVTLDTPQAWLDVVSSCSTLSPSAWPKSLSTLRGLDEWLWPQLPSAARALWLHATSSARLDIPPRL